MKKISLKFISILASVSVLAGCIEETFPEGAGLVAEQLQQTEGALNYMLNAIPVSLVSSGTVGYANKYGVHSDFGIGAMHLHTEFMLEDVATPSNPGYNWFGMQAMNIRMSRDYIYCGYVWDGYYQWIKGANDVIGLIDEKTASASELITLGQAYAYRAAFYLDLARMYIPRQNKLVPVSEAIAELTVPIVTQNTTEQDSKNNPRTPFKEMYEFIINDLEKAYSFLIGKGLGYTTPNEYAVKGLAARAYLELGSLYAEFPERGDSKAAYTKAAEFARDLIDSGMFSPLTYAQWHDPVNGFNNGAANDSWIWGIPLASEVAGNLLTYTAHISTEATWGYAPLTHIAINRSTYHQIPDQDFRKYSWLDPEFEEFYPYDFAGTAEDKENFLYGNGSLGIPAAIEYQSLKFRPAQGEVTDYKIGGCADHVMMRIEEMYFIEAEAYAHMGQLSKAQGILNEFMSMRYLFGTYDCTAKTADLDKFIEEMMFQKRVEFWGEGILYFDYKRLDRGITRGYVGTNHSADMRLNCEGRSPQWNFVITLLEVQSNTAINDQTNNSDSSEMIPLWTN